MRSSMTAAEKTCIASSYSFSKRNFSSQIIQAVSYNVLPLRGSRPPMTRCASIRADLQRIDAVHDRLLLRNDVPAQ